ADVRGDMRLDPDGVARNHAAFERQVRADGRDGSAQYASGAVARKQAAAGSHSGVGGRVQADAVFFDAAVLDGGLHFAAAGAYENARPAALDHRAAEEEPAVGGDADPPRRLHVEVRDHAIFDAQHAAARQVDPDPRTRADDGQPAQRDGISRSGANEDP